MSNLTKILISIEMERDKCLATFLWKYDKDQPLEDNIRQIVNYHNQGDPTSQLPSNGQYALKVCPDNKINKNIFEHFISVKTIDSDINDGYSIKLVPSVHDTVRRLFDERMDNELLLYLSHDLVFIEEIVHMERQQHLIDLVQNGVLTDDGESGALNIFYHLLKNGYLPNLDDRLALKIVHIAQIDKCSSTFAISLLIYILRTREESLSANKSVILDNLKMPYIMSNFNSIANENDKGFHHKVFCLLNSLIEYAKADRRRALLEELNSAENHAIFYDFLKKHRELGEVVAREVFVLQARLITSTYFELYTNRASVTTSLYDEPKRHSIPENYDFLEVGNRSTFREDGAWVSNLQKAESMCSILSLSSISKLPGSPLLEKCLNYGKSFYHTYFDSLEKSDYSCDAELYTIAQNVISLLTNLLCIGMKVHAHSYYLPMFFACRDIKTSNGMRCVAFFEELFIKSLMLLFRTKAEMRVKTKEDFKKLYQVLKKQLKLLFDKRPLNFEECDMYISDVSYNTLQEILQIERDERWRTIYTKNKCVLDLVSDFSERNLELIRVSRYNVLQKGFVFKNMSTKGKYFSLTLMSDCQSLLYADCARNGAHIGDGHKLCIPISAIKHIVHSEHCNLRANNQVPASRTNCVFTIVYDLVETTTTNSIDCYIYKDDSTVEGLKEMEALAEVWKDALNLLIGRTDAYSKLMLAELDELNELDCKMQLIELQDVEIPMHPPPIPKFELTAFA